MKKLVVQPTLIAEWQTLVREAKTVCTVQLDEDLESYLVFLLIRFCEKPEVAESVLGMEFLEGVESLGAEHHQKLRDVADKCLLFSGLFPNRAERRRVNLNYFINLGQTAYHCLSDLPPREWMGPYPALSERFVPLMDVLQSTRDVVEPDPNLLPLDALEQWQKTGSQRAYKRLEEFSSGFFVADNDDDFNIH